MPLLDSPRHRARLRRYRSPLWLLFLWATDNGCALAFPHRFKAPGRFGAEAVLAGFGGLALCAAGVLMQASALLEGLSAAIDGQFRITGREAPLAEWTWQAQGLPLTQAAAVSVGLVLLAQWLWNSLRLPRGAPRPDPSNPAHLLGGYPDVHVRVAPRPVIEQWLRLASQTDGSKSRAFAALTVAVPLAVVFVAARENCLLGIVAAAAFAVGLPIWLSRRSNGVAGWALRAVPPAPSPGGDVQISLTLGRRFDEVRGIEGSLVCRRTDGNFPAPWPREEIARIPLAFAEAPDAAGTFVAAATLPPDAPATTFAPRGGVAWSVEIAVHGTDARDDDEAPFVVPPRKPTEAAE